MGGLIKDILPHPGGSQPADPLGLNKASGYNKLLDPGGFFKPPPPPSDAAILAQQEAQPLLDAAQSGTLTAGQKAQVDLTVAGEKAQGAQLFAKAGLGRSSSAVAALNQAIATGTTMTNDFINQDYQEALSLMGVSNQGLVDAANLAIQQDEQMGQAFGQAAQSFAMIYGNYASEQPSGGGVGVATSSASSAQSGAKSIVGGG